jgi:hypothetical protein
MFADLRTADGVAERFGAHFSSVGVPKNVPELDQIGIKRRPTPTKFVRKSRPKTRHFRPIFTALRGLAKRRLQPLGHLTLRLARTLDGSLAQGEPPELLK